MTWSQDFLLRLHRCKDREDLFLVATDVIRSLGFSSACYGAGLPQPGRRPQATIFQNYPHGWMVHYGRERFLEIDPTVTGGQKSSDIILWNETTFAKAPRLWADAQDFGLRVGLAQSAWAIGGSYGLLSLSREHEPLGAAELEAKQFKILWITQSLHSAMVAKGRVVPESQPKLTAREYEILCWLSEGRTADHIAGRLKISTRTVNYHIGNVLLKLKAANKVQAVVTAIASGLLSI